MAGFARMRSPSTLFLSMICAGMPAIARALPPRFVGPTAVRHSSFNGTANTMMYDVTVRVAGTGSDAEHTAVVGYVSDDDFTTCDDPTTDWKLAAPQVFDVTDTRTWRSTTSCPAPPTATR